MQFNMHEAKSQLSKLGELAWSGEEIVIAKAGVPYLRLTPYQRKTGQRQLGIWRGLVQMSSDFDDDVTIADLFYESRIYPDRPE